MKEWFDVNFLNEVLWIIEFIRKIFADFGEFFGLCRGLWNLVEKMD